MPCGPYADVECIAELFTNIVISHHQSYQSKSFYEGEIFQSTAKKFPVIAESLQ